MSWNAWNSRNTRNYPNARNSRNYPNGRDISAANSTRAQLTLQHSPSGNCMSHTSSISNALQTWSSLSLLPPPAVPLQLNTAACSSFIPWLTTITCSLASEIACVTIPPAGFHVGEVVGIGGMGAFLHWWEEGGGGRGEERRGKSSGPLQNKVDVVCPDDHQHNHRHGLVPFLSNNTMIASPCSHHVRMNRYAY